MIKQFLPACCLLVLMGCSTKPEKTYDVTTIQSVSYSLMDLADHKRQLAQYQQAINLYVDAERYAIKRNDKYLIGLSKLKRAGIRIKQNQLNQAEQLVNDTLSLEKYENVGLTQAIKYLQAQLANAKGEKETAISLVSELAGYYAENPERAIYYQTVRWVYGDTNVTEQQVLVGLNQLEQLKRDSKLINIEILSYTLYQVAEQFTLGNREDANTYIDKAVKHFTDLEMGNKVSQCYELAAAFYKTRDTEKAAYFKLQAENINALLIK